MSETVQRQITSRYVQSWADTIDEGLVPRVIIVSNRHQMGKTASMIRIQEKINEQVLGSKFTIDDLTLTCLEAMQRRKATREWQPVSLDEPERPLGNKSNWDTEAMLFVEDLMTSPFRHTPFLFALPHTHFLNVSIYGVATSEIIKLSKKDAESFEFQRDMLNRSMDVYTPKRFHFTVDMPWSWDWAAYCRKRDEFDTKRGRVLEEKVRRMHSETSDMTKEDVYLLVKGDPKRFTDKNRGMIAATIIETELGISYASAQYAAKKANRLQRDLELAEADKIGSHD